MNQKHCGYQPSIGVVCVFCLGFSFLCTIMLSFLDVFFLLILSYLPFLVNGISSAWGCVTLKKRDLAVFSFN